MLCGVLRHSRRFCRGVGKTNAVRLNQVNDEMILFGADEQEVRVRSHGILHPPPLPKTSISRPGMRKFCNQSGSLGVLTMSDNAAVIMSTPHNIFKINMLHGHWRASCISPEFLWHT